MASKFSKTGQLFIFFVLAFAIGWAAFIPAILYKLYPTAGAFIFLFSPALAACITAWLADGMPGLKELFGRLLLWKFAARWYALAVLLLPVIFLLAGAVRLVQGPVALWTGSPWYFVIASFGFLMFINSGEEIGWRGFALPRLQALIPNRMAAAVILGILWGLWHLPLYLDPQQSSFPLILFMLFIIGLSVIYSVLFNRTGGSLPAAILLHAGTDIAPRFMQIANFNILGWSIVVILTWISALILYNRTNQTGSII